MTGGEGGSSPTPASLCSEHTCDLESRNTASGSGTRCSVAAQSLGDGRRVGSLFARLSARLLFRLTSACAWDPTSAPATKHTSPGTPHASALLLLLLLQAAAATALSHHLLLDHVDDLIGDTQVLDGAATDVALGHPPKLVPIPGCTDHLSKVNVHPVITAHQVPIVCLPIFEFHQHGMILSRLQQRQGKLNPELSGSESSMVLERLPGRASIFLHRTGRIQLSPLLAQNAPFSRNDIQCDPGRWQTRSLGLLFQP